MTENEILLLQDRLYEYLKGLHVANPTFGFFSHNNDLINGHWFDISMNSLNFHLNLISSNAPIYSICFVYNQQVYTCSVKHRFYQKDSNLTKTVKYKLNKISAFLTSLGFSKADSWEQSFSITNDFIQSLDFFIHNHIKAINDIFEKEFGFSKTMNPTRSIIKTIEKEKQFGHVKERYHLLYNPSIPRLPFALSRLEIIGFQGIKHLVIDNIPTDVQWIFLTGNNGYGKTSLLRAIAKGLVGDEDLVEPLPQSSDIYVNGYNWNAPFSFITHHKKLTVGDFQVATYGASRFRYNNEPIKNKKKTFPLFTDDAPLIHIEDILIKAERAKSEKREKNGISRFDKLKKIFLTVIPQLADIKVEYFENELLTDNYQVRYYEKSENGEIYEPVPFSDLAAGYRSILSIIGDMVVRLSAHPNNPLDDLQGIVLIDEFDAHLHPKYQYELPKLLSDAFPKVQFIVSTHSPIPLLGVPKTANAVVLTVHRTAADGITVERLDDDIPFRHLLPNSLLTSPIFGFENLFPRATPPAQIITADHWQDIEKPFNLKKELARLKGGGFMD